VTLAEALKRQALPSGTSIPRRNVMEGETITEWRERVEEAGTSLTEGTNEWDDDD
jgi:hypothetical protein